MLPRLGSLGFAIRPVTQTDYGFDAPTGLHARPLTQRSRCPSCKRWWGLPIGRANRGPSR
jgi:hypothetical protein